ncbi:MAG: glycoside hydrolase family 3 C-terminal domain-containing protein [Terriglobia bacterium]
MGPNANDVKALLGNYFGTPSLAITPVVGIRQKVSPLTKVIYAKGCEPVEPPTIATALDEAVRAAKSADVVAVALGLSGDLENEQFEIDMDGFYWGDRTNLDLPRAQEELLEAVVATGKPTVLLLLNGGPVTTAWASAHAGAIVEAWYPGEEGGTAIADVLFGDYNPGGRLPLSIYKSVAREGFALLFQPALSQQRGMEIHRSDRGGRRQRVRLFHGRCGGGLRQRRPRGPFRDGGFQEHVLPQPWQWQVRRCDDVPSLAVQADQHDLRRPGRRNLCGRHARRRRRFPTGQCASRRGLHRDFWDRPEGVPDRWG